MANTSEMMMANRMEVSRSAATEAIARAIEETAGLSLAVQEDEAGIVLSGSLE